MRKMAFLPSLAAFLNSKGFIYTIRRFEYIPKNSYVDVEGVDICRREAISEVSKEEDLDPYIDMSGFPTIHIWWSMVRGLNKGYPGPYYLYKVSKKEME